MFSLTGSAGRGEVVVVTNDARLPAFNEQRAIAELERLQAAIENARRRRREAENAFDEFVRGFKAAPAEAGAAARIPTSPRIEPPPRSAQPVVSIAQNTSHEQNTHEQSTSHEQKTSHESRPLALPPRHVRWWNTRRIRTRGLGIAGTGLAVLAGVLVVREWRSTPPRTVDAVRAAAPPKVDLPAARTPTAAVAEPAPEAVQRGLTVELTTTRPVWVRVLVDGERAVERELPAGTLLPFRAERTVALRVGDAGAVRLVVNGRDAGSLGPAGQIAVRTFTAPNR